MQTFAMSSGFSSSYILANSSIIITTIIIIIIIIVVIINIIIDLVYFVFEIVRNMQAVQND